MIPNAIRSLTLLLAILVLGGLPLQAHHATFYKSLFATVKDRDLGDVRELFSETGWNGTGGGISAEELQKRLSGERAVMEELRESSELFVAANRGDVSDLGERQWRTGMGLHVGGEIRAAAVEGSEDLHRS